MKYPPQNNRGSQPGNGKMTPPSWRPAGMSAAEKPVQGALARYVAPANLAVITGMQPTDHARTLSSGAWHPGAYCH